jgi:uncharacterized membrane protein YdjX (TVP38/TMEM64 family)
LIVVGLVIGVLLVAGHYARGAFGIEASSEALQAWVLGFGLWGPAAFFLILSFRHLLALPSTLLLTVGGACLGISVGGAVGSVGLLVSALLTFGLSRTMARDRAAERLSRLPAQSIAAVERAAPLVLFTTSAIPPTPATFFYVVAALTPLRVSAFALYTGAGGIVRAYLLAALGTGLMASDWTLVAAAVGLLAAMVGAAALSPTLRSLMFPGARPGAKDELAVAPEPEAPR